MRPVRHIQLYPNVQLLVLGGLFPVSMRVDICGLVSCSFFFLCVWHPISKGDSTCCFLQVEDHLGWHRAVLNTLIRQNRSLKSPVAPWMASVTRAGEVGGEQRRERRGWFLACKIG